MKPRLTIVGLGRLGTMIGLALKKTGADLEIVGHDKDRAAITTAQKANALDKGEWNLYNACEGAGLVILAMPLAGVLENIELLKDDLAPGVIVTDTASVKMPVIAAAKVFKPGVHYIGGHPIFRPSLDGTAPNTELPGEALAHAIYCLTPTPDADPDAVQVITGYVSMLGAKPLFLDPEEHDGLAAGAQHLAALSQSALLKTVTASSGWRELNKFAGDDFYRATEYAGDPASTAQVMLAQRGPLSSWIDLYSQSLYELRTLLSKNDAAALTMWLKAAQDARVQWLHNEVGAADPSVDLSEVRSGALRMFLGGLATRFGGDKKK
jgi:prephenate dehydrogenase